jgi:hypothetical protein
LITRGLGKGLIKQRRHQGFDTAGEQVVEQSDDRR